MEEKMLKNFRTYQLAVQFYRASRALPGPANLRDQLQRAASSIALNLAEGSGKTSRKDQLRFYEIALGSLRECEAAIDLLGATDPQVLSLIDSLARHTFNLCKALKA
jgi:four helix bundle protein